MKQGGELSFPVLGHGRCGYNQLQRTSITHTRTHKSAVSPRTFVLLSAQRDVRCGGAMSADEAVDVLRTKESELPAQIATSGALKSCQQLAKVRLMHIHNELSRSQRHAQVRARGTAVCALV